MNCTVFRLSPTNMNIITAEAYSCYFYFLLIAYMRNFHTQKREQHHTTRIALIAILLVLCKWGIFWKQFTCTFGRIVITGFLCQAMYLLDIKSDHDKRSKCLLSVKTQKRVRSKQRRKSTHLIIKLFNPLHQHVQFNHSTSKLSSFFFSLELK